VDDCVCVMNLESDGPFLAVLCLLF